MTARNPNHHPPALTLTTDDIEFISQLSILTQTQASVLSYISEKDEPGVHKQFVHFNACCAQSASAALSHSEASLIVDLVDKVCVLFYTNRELLPFYNARYDETLQLRALAKLYGYTLELGTADDDEEDEDDCLPSPPPNTPLQ